MTNTSLRPPRPARPAITGPALTRAVREHYDALSRYYGLFWGDHLHHGYWHADESRHEAQIGLIQKLAQDARIPRNASVLDVGCGLGGSARWLAKNRGCSVEGITLSPAQAKIAQKKAHAEKLARKVRFEVRDASSLDADQLYDVVWCVECSEHLPDKKNFLKAAYAALKPGGVLALCAWLDNARTEEQRDLIGDICERMICPELWSAEQYRLGMERAGFRPIIVDDLTRRVTKTWDICVGIAERPEVKMLTALLGKQTSAFIDSFPMMRRAFATRAMRYGLFAAWKPAGKP